MSEEKKSTDKPKKKKKGLVIVLVLFLLLLIAAGVVGGLAFTGKLKIPGITPKKYLTKTTTKVAEKPKPKAKPKPKPTKQADTPPPVPLPTEDPNLGAKKLALVWNEMQPEKLKEVLDPAPPAKGQPKVATKPWNPTQAARVLNAMEPEKAAALLSVLSPKVASEISTEMQRLASKIETTQ